jgi:hypothetical protein
MLPYLHSKYLPRVYLAPWREVVDAEKSFQFHVMATGYFIGTVPTLDTVCLGTCTGLHHICSFTDNQSLSNVQTRAPEIVETHDLFSICVIAPCQKPEGVPSFDTVNNRS